MTIYKSTVLTAREEHLKEKCVNAKEILTVKLTESGRINYDILIHTFLYVN